MNQVRLRVRRGNRSGLPDLAEGELGYAIDTREVFIGTAGAENVQVSTAQDVGSSIAAHRVEAGAHDVVTITGAETPIGAQAKVDAHTAATTAHNVSQVTDAVSTSYLSANYYDKTASDAGFMRAGMSPIVAAIVFGG